MIDFKNVSKVFKQGDREVVVLKDLSFHLAEKGNIAIVGKSGSGKSTVLSLMAGLDKASDGVVSLSGINLNELSEKEMTKFRALNIGIVFQNFHLIENFTALENVMLPLETLSIKEPREKALKMLATVGLSDRVDHFPNQLSGGEKQRVAIARAVVTNPKIILADEPSGNLDPETGLQVMSLMLETAKKLDQTLIIVTHDEDLARKCDVIFELKDQKLTKI